MPRGIPNKKKPKVARVISSLVYNKLQEEFERISNLNQELKSVAESYEQSKRVWNRQEDDFLMQQTQLDRQVFNLHQELNAAQHTIFVLAEKLLDERNNRIHEDNMNTYIALRNSNNNFQAIAPNPVPSPDGERKFS